MKWEERNDFGGKVSFKLGPSFTKLNCGEIESTNLTKKLKLQNNSL